MDHMSGRMTAVTQPGIWRTPMDACMTWCGKRYARLKQAKLSKQATCGLLEENHISQC